MTAGTKTARTVHPHISLLRAIARTKLNIDDERWIQIAKKGHNEPDAVRMTINGLLMRDGLAPYTHEMLEEMIARGVTEQDIMKVAVVASVGDVVAAAEQETDLTTDEQIDVVHEQAIEAAKDIANALDVPLYVNDEQVAGPKKPLSPNEIVASSKLLKVNVPQKALAKAISTVSPASSSRTVLPVLQHLLLTRSASNNTLRIAATNLEVGVTCAIPLLPSLDAEDGAATLPAKLFSEFVAAVPSNEEITIDATDATTTTVKLQSKRHKAVMHRFDSAEFPTIPELTGDEPGLTLDVSQFRQLISGAAFAAAPPRDARPVFTAVNIEFASDRVVFVAADSFRLAVQEIPLLPGMLSDELVGTALLIPATSLAIADHVLPQNGKVTISLAGHRNQMYFVGVSESEVEPIVTVVSNLVSGVYPNWRAIMPLASGNGTRITIGRDALRSALKGTMLFARDAANIVRITSEWGEGDKPATIAFAASADEVGEGSVTYDVLAHDGPEMRMTLNGVYLRDVIDAIDGDIALYWAGKLKPLLIKAASGSQERVDGFTYVMMPMHNTKGGDD